MVIRHKKLPSEGSPFKRANPEGQHLIIRDVDVSFRGEDDMVQDREFQQFVYFHQLTGEG